MVVASLLLFCVRTKLLFFLGGGYVVVELADGAFLHAEKSKRHVQVAFFSPHLF